MKKNDFYDDRFYSNFCNMFINLDKIDLDKRLLFKQLSFTNQPTYYLSNDTVLSGFISDIYLDPKYALAVANFASKNFKLRTSVQVIIGQVSQMISASPEQYQDENNEYKDIIRRKFNEWVSRPDILADVIWTYTHITGTKISQIPTFLKVQAKKRLETFDKKSLVKHRLESREIKLKDLIKIYRPKPATVEMATVFKEIIEGKQKLEKEEFIRLVTDSEVNKTELKEKLTKKLVDDSNKLKNNDKTKFNIPLNALIKNLPKFQEDNDSEVIELIKMRLDDAINNNVSILNPFDLLINSKNLDEQDLSGDVVDLLNKQILKSFSNIDYRFKEDFDIILDISGSMFNNNWIKTTSKYIALLLTLGHISGVKTNLNLFIDGLLERDRDTYTNQSGDKSRPYLPIRYKSIIELYEHLDKNLKSEYLLNKPLELYWYILNKFDTDFSVIAGGTQLKRSLVTYNRKSYKKDNLVIISDEMTWDDDVIDNLLFGFVETGNIILINPVPAYGVTPFSQKSNVLRLSGLNPKIFDYSYIIHNFEEFKKKIIQDL